MTTQRDDPYGAFNFVVTVAGVSEDGHAARGSFAEVSGLDVEIEPIEYRTGIEPTTVRKLPGLTKYGNVTLKRGVTGDLLFWQWMRTAIDGQVQRADVTITLLDEARNAVLRWHLRRAWVCKYVGPTLRATGSEVAIETIELCHEGLEIE